MFGICFRRSWPRIAFPVTVSLSNCAQHMPQSARDKLVTVVVDMTYYHGTGGHLARTQKVECERKGVLHRMAMFVGDIWSRPTSASTNMRPIRRQNIPTSYTGMEVLNSIPLAHPFRLGSYVKRSAAISTRMPLATLLWVYLCIWRFCIRLLVGCLLLRVFAAMGSCIAGECGVVCRDQEEVELGEGHQPE